MSMFWWIETQSAMLKEILFVEYVVLKIVTKLLNATLGLILVISQYFLNYGNLHAKCPSEFSLCHYPPKHRHSN